MRLILGFVAILGLASAQRSDREERRSPELEAIVGLARTTPPAIQAYALTRVALRTGPFNRKWKNELLTEAFELASLAPDPYPMRLIPGLKQSSPITLRSRRYSLGFDQLSLQMNALQFMAFGRDVPVPDRIPRPRPQAVSCADAMIPDVGVYYRSLIFLNRQSNFLAGELRRENPHVAFYESVLMSMESPVEVVPAAQMLAGITFDRANSAMLLNRFATALSTMHGDDRSFSSTLYELPEAIKRLTDAMSERGVDPAALHGAVKEYLVRHFRARRCGDTGSDTALTAKVASAFDLDPEELKPLDLLDGPELGVEHEPAPITSLREMWNHLQFEGFTGPKSEGRATRFEQFVAKLDDWTPDPGQEDEVFYPMKQAFFESVLITSQNREQIELLKRYIGFLNTFPRKPEMQAEAFASAQCLSRVLPAVLAEVRADVLNSLERSRNPMLSLYVQLEHSRR